MQDPKKEHRDFQSNNLDTKRQKDNSSTIRTTANPQNMRTLFN